MISTKGRYALLVMIDLAQHESEGNISLKAIAERQNVSLKYLESIVAMLNRGGLVVSTRGKDGGYRLARPADRINANEVICVTEGSLALMACPDCSGSTCTRADFCLTQPMWQHLEEIASGYLSGITIRALANGEVK